MAFSLHVGPTGALSSAAVNTMAVTLVGVSAGDLVLVFCGTENPSINSVACDTGETVVLLTQRSTSSNLRKARIGWFTATSSSSKVLTATVSSAVGYGKTITAVAFTPGAGTPAFHTENGVAVTSASPSVNLTTTLANLLAIGFITTDGVVEPTVGSNYTVLSAANGSNFRTEAEYDLDSGAAGTVAVNFTVTSAECALTAAAFYEDTTNYGGGPSVGSASGTGTAVAVYSAPPATKAFLGGPPVSVVAGASATTIAVTLTGCTAGHSIVIGASWQSTATVSSIVCTGETVTSIRTQTSSFTTYMAWIPALVTGGDKTITITLSVSSGTRQITAAEFYSLTSLEANAGTSATSSNPSVNLTTLTNNALVVANINTAGSVATAGVGYTGVVTGSSNSLYEYDLDGGAAGTRSVSSVKSVSDFWLIAAASFAVNTSAVPVPVFFQSVQGSTVGTSLAIVVPNTGPGNTLVCLVAMRSGTATISSITCSGESALSVRGSPSRNTTMGSSVQGADLLVLTTGGSKTVTITCSASISIRAVVMEFSGVTAFADSQGANANDTANPTVNVTTSAAGSLLVGCVASSNAQTVGSEFSDAPIPDDATAGSIINTAQFRCVSGAAGTTVIGTTSGGTPSTDDWAIVGLAYTPLVLNSGTAAGTSTATGVSAVILASVGAAAGTSTAAATSVGTFPGVGAAAGTSGANAVSVVIIAAVGSASGLGSATGIGVAAGVAAGAGHAAGTSTALAVNGSIDLNTYGTLVARLPLMDAQLQGVYQATITAVIPAMRALITAGIKAQGTIDARLPRMSMTAAGGMDGIRARLTTMRAQIVGHPSVTARLSAVLLRPRALLTGGSPFGGEAALRFLPMRVQVWSHVVPVGALDARIPRLRARLSGLPGVGAAVSARLPVMRAGIRGYVHATGAITARLPRLRAQLVARVTLSGGAQAGAGSVRTLVLNTANMALTEYAQYPFNSFTEFNGAYLAAGEEGIFQIDMGDNDMGVDIVARWSTAQMDFGSEFLKRMTDAYAGMRANGPLLVRVTVDENGVYATYDYVLDPLAISTIRQRRVPIGKGLRGKYWQFEFVNVDGSYFEIDTTNLATVIVGRRI